MKFSLPGQLKGPECRRVISQAVALRKRVTPWFAAIDNTEISELGIALRVDGSLGSFGPEGVENITVKNGKVECDVVNADKGWADLDDSEIASILQKRVFDGIAVCFERYEIPFDQESLCAAIK